MLIKDLLLQLKTNTVQEILGKLSDSDAGKAYEGLWDIVIKFKVVFKDAIHYVLKQNTSNKTILKDYKKNFLDKNCGTNSDGFSDITFALKDELYASTCKFTESKNIDDWDILKAAKSLEIHKSVQEKHVLVLTKNKQVFEDKLSRANNKGVYEPYIYAVYDINDLEKYLKHVCDIMDKHEWNLDSIVEYLGNKRTYMKLLFHQKLCLLKTMSMPKGIVLWGLKSRSGKSYIMAGHIVINKNKNSLIVTSYPKESISQLINLFNSYVEFKDHHIVECKDGMRVNPDKPTIYIMSKQYLDNKMEKIDNKRTGKSSHKIFDVEFDCVYFDETHQGGITENTEQILNLLKYKQLIAITATFDKPLYNWKIQPSNCFFWDLEDEKKCKQGLINEYV